MKTYSNMIADIQAMAVNDLDGLIIAAGGTLNIPFNDVDKFIHNNVVVTEISRICVKQGNKNITIMYQFKNEDGEYNHMLRAKACSLIDYINHFKTECFLLKDGNKIFQGNMRQCVWHWEAIRENDKSLYSIASKNGIITL